MEKKHNCEILAVRISDIAISFLDSSDLTQIGLCQEAA